MVKSTRRRAGMALCKRVVRYLSLETWKAYTPIGSACDKVGAFRLTAAHSNPLRRSFEAKTTNPISGPDHAGQGLFLIISNLNICLGGLKSEVQHLIE